MQNTETGNITTFINLTPETYKLFLQYLKEVPTADRDRIVDEALKHWLEAEMVSPFGVRGVA